MPSTYLDPITITYPTTRDTRLHLAVRQTFRAVPAALLLAHPHGACALANAGACVPEGEGACGDGPLTPATGSALASEGGTPRWGTPGANSPLPSPGLAPPSTGFSGGLSPHRTTSAGPSNGANGSKLQLRVQPPTPPDLENVVVDRFVGSGWTWAVFAGHLDFPSSPREGGAGKGKAPSSPSGASAHSYGFPAPGEDVTHDDGASSASFHAPGTTRVVIKVHTPSHDATAIAREAWVFERYLFDVDAVPRWYGLHAGSAVSIDAAANGGDSRVAGTGGESSASGSRAAAEAVEAAGTEFAVYVCIMGAAGEPVDVASLSEDDKHVVSEKYAQLHAAGVVHGAPAAKHWLVPRGASANALRIVDFRSALVQNKIEVGNGDADACSRAAEPGTEPELRLLAAQGGAVRAKAWHAAQAAEVAAVRAILWPRTCIVA